MRSLLRFLARSIAFVCAFIFVIVGLVTLLLFNVDRRLLLPDTYKLALAEQEIYERLPELAAEQVTYQINYSDTLAENLEGEGEDSPPGEGNGLLEPIRNLGAADIEKIIDTLLPAGWLQEQAEKAIDILFSSLHDDDHDELVVIQLDEFKSRITGEQGVQAIMQLIRAQPVCDMPESMPFDCNDMTDGLTVCHPPEEILESCIPEIRVILEEGTVGMPDAISLNQFVGDGTGGSSSVEASTNDGEGLEGLRRVISLIPLIVRLGSYILAVLTLIIALFAVRSVGSLLRWWGVPILIVGALALVMVGAMLPLTNWAIDNYLVDRFPQSLSPDLVQIGLDIGRDIVGSFAKSIGIQAAGITLVGLVMVAGSSLLRRNATPSPEKALS